MLQSRSLIPKVEVLSLRGDKTSICCVKVLQSIWNFYHHKIAKKCRGWEVTPRPRKCLPENFCQPRDAPILHLPTAIWPKGLEWGGKGVQSGQKWGRQKWPISVRGQNFSSNYWKHITLNCTKYECQCNTIHKIHFFQFDQWSESSGFEIDLAFVRNVFWCDSLKRLLLNMHNHIVCTWVASHHYGLASAFSYALLCWMNSHVLYSDNTSLQMLGKAWFCGWREVAPFALIWFF